MEKEDFKLGDPDLFIDDAYVLKTEDYILIIDKDIFDDDTVKYAEKITEKYKNNKDLVLNYALDNRLRIFYGSSHGYSDQYIKDNIGRPQIKIYSKKDDEHPEWKFNYAGAFEFCESNLDEHVIIVEFCDDLIMNSVQIDG